MRKKKAAILGASGYTGGELLRFLLTHPHVEAAYLTADKHAGRNISDVFPHLGGFLDRRLEPLDPGALPGDIDVVFLALPHGESARVVRELYKKDLKIIDLGADFRLSHGVYKDWYGDHPCPELIEEAVYGLPEINRPAIKGAKLVANPGCYPTSAILGLAPLLKENLIEPDSIIVDSKSGVSGAGRSPSLDYHFCEVNEGVRAYKIGEHRHMPEIEEVLSVYSGVEVNVSFTPHLIPMDRGILSTIYVRLKKKRTTGQLIGLFEEHYGGERFIRISPEKVYPSTSQVRGSNFCDIGMRADPENKTAIIVSVIDNLVKGASGAAVQNMNVMMGFEESASLEVPPIFP
ncbi:MAG: N-acetyl-gamma-glutamyl-phosphate reductase [Candidatus Dadabacteria bacterium RIFCSPHIGHO2_12_FULL_53_21]|nr:MAG: N-acetyl-gamma-glutamyl-phosphate reductase [Candidatus Dadabacteria bacterium RIFCSPHIGHO2_12_FULL_53_21]